MQSLVTQLSMKTKVWISCMAVALIGIVGLGSVNALLDTVSEADLCKSRQVGREAIRGSQVGNWQTYINFQRNRLEKNGYTPTQMAQFNTDASEFLELLRQDSLKVFPPITC